MSIDGLPHLPPGTKIPTGDVSIPEGWGPAVEQPVQEQQAVPEPVIEETVTELEASPEQPIEQEAPEQQERYQARNFKVLREQAEKMQYERDEAVRQLKSMNQPKTADVVTDDDIHVGDDELIEGKHLSKMASKIKKLEAQIYQQQAQTAESVIETQLRLQYPDIAEVLSEDNLKSLRMAYPDLADSINANPNFKSKAMAAYTTIKQLGLHTMHKVNEQDKKRVQTNLAKPRPLTSMSSQKGGTDSALSHANAFANGELTEEVKAAAYREMMEARLKY